MILVYLFRHGALVIEQPAETEAAADRMIDQMITDVLQNKHGPGEFRIDADHVNARLMPTGLHFASGNFRHPAPPRKVKKPAS